MSNHSHPTAPSPRLLRLGVALSFMLMLMALGLFGLALKRTAPDRHEGTLVNVTADGCQPSRLEVPAGERTFTVVNRSSRAIEWEIIDGVMVLAERENIAPGLRQPLTVNLKPGDYDITCGLLSNPRGSLHVTPGDDTGQPPGALTATDLIGPLAEYRVYITLQLRQLQQQVTTLATAIDSGDVAAARQAYLDARRSEQRLAVPIGLFSDLDQRLNARADYFAQRERDPDFGGFPRIAMALYQDHTTAGLEPVIQRLEADIEQLKTRLADLSLPPAQLADGSARVLRAWHDNHDASTVLTTPQLAELRGLTAGVDKIVGLLAPLLENRSPDTLERLDHQLTTLQQALDDAGDETEGEAARHLIDDSAALADTLAGVNQAFGLNG